jgi:hypothetical protein
MEEQNASPRAAPHSPIISVSLVLVIWPWEFLAGRLTRLARFCHAVCRTWQVSGLWHRIVTRLKLLIITPIVLTPVQTLSLARCSSFGATVDELHSIGRTSSRFRVGNTAVDSRWLRFRMGLQ